MHAGAALLATPGVGRGPRPDALVCRLFLLLLDSLEGGRQVPAPRLICFLLTSICPSFILATHGVLRVLIGAGEGAVGQTVGRSEPPVRVRHTLRHGLVGVILNGVIRLIARSCGSWFVDTEGGKQADRQADRHRPGKRIGFFRK